MSSNKKRNKEIGDLGEKITVNYLKRRGFSILEQNYLRKWGEIDVIASKNNVVHFVEVKTVSHETKRALEDAVARGTWRPEEQVHQFKLHQIHKALETWIADKNYEGEWQIDVAAVRVVLKEKHATMRYIENIIE